MIHRSSRFLGLLVGIVMATGILITGWGSPAFAAGPKVNGGGASFPQIEFDQWTSVVASKPYNLAINYVPAGSTFGRTNYLSGSFDFGVSDIAFSPEELAQAGNGPRKNLVYVPVSAGGLAFMYNLVDNSGNPVNTLKLSANAACRVFAEVGLKWNDPEIAGLNPGLDLPNRDVLPFVRADGSGTSYVLSEYCKSRAAYTWSKFLADRVASEPSLAATPFGQGLPTSNWPLNWGRVSGQQASDGVSDAVALTPDGITYVETGFAINKKKPVAAVQNAAGAFVLPTAGAVSKALAFAVKVADGTYSLNYAGSDGAAYFPSTYSYVITQTTGAPADKGDVLGKFLCYAVTAGQDSAERLGYARLSAQLVSGAVSAIGQIPGAPQGTNCSNIAALLSGTTPTVATTTQPASTGGGGSGATTTTTRAGTPSGGAGNSGGVATTTRQGTPTPTNANGGGGTTPGTGSTRAGASQATTSLGVSSAADTLPGQPAVSDTLPGQPAVVTDAAGNPSVGSASQRGSVAQGVSLIVARTARRAPDASPDNSESVLWLVQGGVIFGLGRAVAKQRKQTRLKQGTSQ